jgi:hypothetical protein
VEEEDRLRVQRTWLRGSTTGRAALVLSFAHVSQPGGLDTSLVVGTVIDAAAAYFRGALPLRAVMTDRQGTPGLVEAMPGEATALAALAGYAAALAQNPWLERFPTALTAVVPMRRGDAWAVADGEGRLLPLRRNFGLAWELLALSGGSPIGLFGEWDGESQLPLSAFAAGRLVAL